MKRSLVFMAVVMMGLLGCESDSNSTATVTSAQSKALSKIDHVKGAHSSTNGTTSLSLNERLRPMGNDCYKYSYSKDFDSFSHSVTPCSQIINFASFENDSLKTFSTTTLGSSTRTDTGKKMGFYIGTDTSAFFVDAKFYKDDYYSGPGISDNGSFFYSYQKSDNTAMYFIMYTWDESEGVSVNLDDISQPKISDKLTSISIGNKDDMCSMSQESTSYCKIYVNVYNTETTSYDQYTASFESLMSQGMSEPDVNNLTFDLMNSDNKKIGSLKMNMEEFIFTVVDLAGNTFK